MILTKCVENRDRESNAPTFALSTDWQDLLAAIDRIPGQRTCSILCFGGKEGAVIRFESEISQAGMEGLAHIVKWIEIVPVEEDSWRIPQLNFFPGTADADEDGEVRWISFSLNPGDLNSRLALAAGLDEPVDRPSARIGAAQARTN